MSLKYTDLSDCTNAELVKIVTDLHVESVYVDVDSDASQVWYSEWHERKEGAFDVQVFFVKHARSSCSYGQSDLVEQSNFRALQEDFPDAFTEMRWSNVSQLGIRADKLTGEIVNALAGLADYCLYDEDDHSSLESETFDKAVSDYLVDDGMRWSMDETDADALREFDADARVQAFFTACNELEIYPEFEYEDAIFSKEDMRSLMSTTLEILRRPSA